MSSMYPSFGGAAVRPCMRCGAPLSPSESQCSRCGLLNPPPQGQQSGMFQQGQQGRSTGQSWGVQVPQSPQFPQNGGSSTAWGQQAGGWQQNQNAFSPGQNRMPSQPLQNNLFGGNNGAGFGNTGGLGNNGSFGGQNRSSLNDAFANYQNNPQNNFFAATQQGYDGPALGTASGPLRGGPGSRLEPGRSKKRSNAGVVILIIVLLFAVIGGGGGYFGYKYFKSQGNTARPNTTPVVITTPTGTPTFGDTFKDNAANWNTTAPTNTKITVSNGKMVLESDSHGVLLPEILPGGKSFADFRIDVDAALARGDNTNGYGIYIRASSTQNNPLGLYYRFEVYGDGSFVIYLGKADQNGNSVSTELKSSGPNDAVFTDGRLNHLTVSAKGTQLSFAINGTTVSTFSDPTYKSGTVALFVSNLNPPNNGSPTPATQQQPATAQATFERLAIFPAQ